ncbi:hypothetical protein AAC387_Pa08g0224 [Persea americana]
MHHKKSETQIGKESSGVSSDFNPTPPFLPFHQNHIQILTPHPQIQIPNNPTTTTLQIIIPNDHDLHHNHHPNNSNSNSIHNKETPTFLSTPHKRTLNAITPSLSHSQSLNSIPFSTSSSIAKPSTSSSPCPFSSKALKVVFCTFRQLRHLHLHLRMLLFFSLPSFYFFLSNPNSSFLLDFLSALAFSAALLLSFNLALPRLPSIRLLLRRSFPLKLSSPSARPSQPVFWSIGSNPKSEKSVISGTWVQVYTNGDVYEGEFHRGRCSGSGVYYYYMSGRYEGDWVDEKYDGYGVETWARGSRYRGQYRQGLRHGFGVYRFYTGDVYSGEWSNGQSHGCGVHTCEDGSRYVGEFKWGVKHGLGHYHFRNGDTYFGEYFADKMHGFGVYRFANGHRYEGAWHEGRRQGLGMYTFRNGETQSGHWQNGALDTLSTHNTHASFPVAVNHSKVLNAVQEARRAAEKAFDVARVDDRVNKAIVAANKAANAARVAAVKAVQKRINNSHDIPIPIV